MSVTLFRMVALIGFGPKAKGDRLSPVLDEELSSLKADTSRGVWGPKLLDMTGRQRPFSILDDHVEHVEETGDGPIRGESFHLEHPDIAGIPFGC